MTEALAWPVVALVSAVILRAPLYGLLSGPLRKLKVGPFEAEWETASEVVNENVRKPPSDRSASPAEVSAEYAPDAELSPTTAILEAHGAVERELGRILAEHGVFDAPRGTVQMARVAVRDGIISAGTARSVEGVSVLRNLAAHAPSGETTADRAQEYLAMVDAVLFSLRSDAGRAHTGAGFGDGSGGSGGGVVSGRGHGDGTGSS
jgi:hypothetical protein